MIGTVYASDYIYNLDYTDLPFNDTLDIIVNGVNNLTLYIDYSNFTYGHDTLNFTSSSIILSVNVHIPKNTEPINYTESVILYNNDINFTHNLTFEYNIYNDTPSPTVDYIQLDFNEYKYSICSYSLPWNNTKKITISGVFGQEIYTLFNEDFIDVVDKFIIGTSNFSIIDVNMHLNENVTEGVHTRVIQFSVVDGSSNITIHFDVQNCIRPPPEYNAMIEACAIVNKTPQEALYCQQLQTEYNLALYQAMLEAQEVRIEQNTTIKYVNNTVRIPVLDLNDQSIITALKEIPRTWNQMISEQREKDKLITTKNDEIKALITDKETLQRNIREEVGKAVNSMTEESKLKQNTIDMYEDKYMKKATLGWLIFWVIFIGGGFYLYTIYQDNNMW